MISRKDILLISTIFYRIWLSPRLFFRRRLLEISFSQWSCHFFIGSLNFFQTAIIFYLFEWLDGIVYLITCQKVVDNSLELSKFLNSFPRTDINLKHQPSGYPYFSIVDHPQNFPKIQHDVSIHMRQMHIVEFEPVYILIESRIAIALVLDNYFLLLISSWPLFKSIKTLISAFLMAAHISLMTVIFFLAGRNPLHDSSPKRSPRSIILRKILLSGRIDRRLLLHQ